MEAKTKTKTIQFTPETKPEYFGKIKKPEPIKWQVDKRKALDDGVEWYYSHLGDIQGPWDGKVMRKWLEAGHFTPSLEIRMGSVGDFAELEMHFANINDAFCIPSELHLSLLSIGNTTFATCLGEKIENQWLLTQGKQRIQWGQASRESKVYMGEYYVGKLGEINKRLPDFCGFCGSMMTPSKVGSVWNYECNCVHLKTEAEIETETKFGRKMPKPSDLDGMVKPSASVLFEQCHNNCRYLLKNRSAKTEASSGKLQLDPTSVLLTKKLLVDTENPWLWKDWRTGDERKIYFWEDGTIFSDGRFFGYWNLNNLVTGIAMYQQPDDWTTLCRSNLCERIEITLNYFVDEDDVGAVFMYILVEHETGMHYLQQDCSYFQNIDGKVMLADVFGKPTKSASKKIL